MHRTPEIKSAVRRYLSNHRTSAEVTSRTMGLLTKPLRETNVAMFHIGRCGSTAVGVLLNQHPKIRWGGEIFAGLKRKYGRNSWVWEDPLRMIRLRTNIHVCRVFGAEIKRKHFEDVNMEVNTIVNKLEKIGYKKYIILRRKNYLKREVSRLVGSEMKKWNFEEDVEPPAVSIPVESINGKNIINHFREIDEFYEKIEKSISGKKLLKINYEEDIKESPKLAFEKIAEWLNLKKVETKVATKKINKKPIKKRISNFEEVRKALDKTEYKWMAQEE